MGRKSIANIRKPEILKHAYKLVEEEGFAGTSINKIAKRMGINSGLLIHYFKTKDALIIELVDYLFDISVQSYQDVLSKKLTPSERMEVLLDILFNPVITKPYRGKVYWSCYDMGLRNKKVGERIKQLNQKLIEFTVTEIKLYEKAGLTKFQNLEETATIVFAIVEGFGYIRNTLPDNPNIDNLARFMKKMTYEALGIKRL